MVNYKRDRFAFSMLELVFAIVIISIPILSLPMVSQVVATSTEKNNVQEAILIASAELKKAISGKWDENTQVDDSKTFEYILYTQDDEINASTNKRKGNINIIYQPDNTLRPSNNGLEAGETLDDADDVDDYITTSTTDTNTTKSERSSQGYKDEYKKIIVVAYPATFGNLSDDKNIKKVEITVSDSNDNEIVKLSTYVTNCGSVTKSPSRRLK